MFPKYDGLKFTVKQIMQFALGSQGHDQLLKELRLMVSGKSVLLCGAGESFNDFNSYLSDYDVVFGMNGLFRLLGDSGDFDYFFIEDRAAYGNYVDEKSNSSKLITVAGMPGNVKRQLNFIHKYGYPFFMKSPKISRSGRCFFWGGSVAFFAMNVLLVSEASKIGVLGVDLCDTNGYAVDGYRRKSDTVMTPNFQASRDCLKGLFLASEELFPKTVIADLGNGAIFE